MFRRITVTVLVLAVALIGVPPVSASHTHQGAATAAHDCCCEDDQPQHHHDRNTAKDIACAAHCGAVSPASLPAATSVASRDLATDRWALSDAPLLRTGCTAPPLRPPCPSSLD